MKPKKIPRVYFIIWNTFQYYHFKPLFELMDNAVLVVLKRKQKYTIDFEVISMATLPVLWIDKNEIFQEIGSVADVIVVQTIFEQIHLFRRSKIVMLQYGYAKEKHNYGRWRALADVNLVYGQYAADKIKHLSPVKVTGCPRYDSWHDKIFKKRCEEEYASYMDSSKKTLLYAPSWGDVSSFSYHIQSLLKLTNEYNVLVKVHHNSLLTSAKDYYEQFANISFFYDDTEILSLISVSDLVISDYSGAIFDAMYCKKPVVLLSVPENIDFKEVVGVETIEIQKRYKLGYVADRPEKLLMTIKTAIANGPLVNDDLTERLFTVTDRATKNVVTEINQICSQPTKRSLRQKWNYLNIKRRLTKIALKKEQKLY